MKITKQQIFIALYALFICVQILSESQYSVLSPYSSIITILRYGILAAFVVMVITGQLYAQKGQFLVSLVLILATVMNLLLFDGGIGLIYIVFVCLSSKNIPLEKIFKTSVFSMVITYAFVMISSQIGILQDTIGVRYLGLATGNYFAGEYVRHSMGFFVSNQVPISFFFIYLLLIVWRKKNISLWLNVVFFVLNFWVFYNFGSRIVFVLTFIAIVFYYFIAAKERFAFRKIKNGRISIFSFIFIGCGFLSFMMSILYNSHSRIFNYIDLFFNHRVSMASAALEYYRVTLLGLGKDAGTYNGLYNTITSNTVDNGYVLIFIQRGILIGLIIIFFWSYLCNIAAQKRNQYLMFVLILLAIENIINADFISYHSIAFYCILLNQNDLLLEDRILPKLAERKKQQFKIRWGIKIKD